MIARHKIVCSICQKLSKVFAERFERLVYSNEYKTITENKKRTNEYRFFLASNFVEVCLQIVCFDEIRKVATGQGEDYTTGCLLDSEYIKNLCRLVLVDLCRQNKLDAHPKAIQQILRWQNYVIMTVQLRKPLLNYYVFSHCHLHGFITYFPNVNITLLSDVVLT